MFDKVLVANRGEIALRVIRGCRDLGVHTVAVHSEADRTAPFVLMADEAVEIGPPPSAQSYLMIDRIIDAAKQTGAQAIHPGYGFLSENQDFARACQDNGIVFIGPPAEAMAAMGEKVPARERMRDSGVPVVPGSDALDSVEDAVAEAARIGYPVLIKASAGGGGIGMRVARSEQELRESVETAKSTAKRAFGNETVFLERYLDEPRHIEIQVLGDVFGNVIHLGERECSIQRRHQKIVEETPSPVIDDTMRARMGQAAVTAAQAVGYVNAGTVEFIYRHGEFYFLEMNTRLQVEHPITELVYGVDLVAEQLRVASGEELSLRQEDMAPHGHAIECRVNAEQYRKGFLPSPGQVTGYHEPAGPGVRVDSALVGPALVSPNYDPMIAKLIVHAHERGAAIDRMRRALYEYIVTGINTNIPYHLALMSHPEFREGRYSTHFID
ncbi:MAG: acetyl-CoA carboxylase biotin carboxylase subunit, partial [Candidatus Dormibacteraeota bacterium]|nr:acetyl-CoA carboxylase biotin carboxylase subunit [Candidatus Dormibacteraeota bacterium]